MNIRKKIALYLTDKFNSVTNCILYNSIEDLKELKDPESITGKNPVDIVRSANIPKIRTDDTIKEEWTLQTVQTSNNSIILKFKLNFRKK